MSWSIDTKTVTSLWFIDMGAKTQRWLTGETAKRGEQGQILYSDDEGLTWITVNIGGPTDGHGARTDFSIFVLDQYHIWLASAAGYIYYSSDGGKTWTVQEAGTITERDYIHIFFANGIDGVAMTFTGQLVITHNGGQTWQMVEEGAR